MSSLTCHRFTLASHLHTNIYLRHFDKYEVEAVHWVDALLDLLLLGPPQAVKLPFRSRERCHLNVDIVGRWWKMAHFESAAKYTTPKRPMI